MRRNEGKLIVVGNRKGGVGKTTCTVALAHTFHQQLGMSVCVVDTDPQASASIALLGDIDPENPLRLLSGAPLLERSLSNYQFHGAHRPALNLFTVGNVKPFDANVEIPFALVPTSPDYWRKERELLGSRAEYGPRQQWENRFERMLRTLRETFDVVMVDTPPGVSVLTASTLEGADLFLVPCRPDRISVLGLTVLSAEIQEVMDVETMRRRARMVWTMTASDGVSEHQVKALGMPLPFASIPQPGSNAKEPGEPDVRYASIPQSDSIRDAILRIAGPPDTHRPGNRRQTWAARYRGAPGVTLLESARAVAGAVGLIETHE
jgi:cellulose biosynthesis protein BcsQ